MKKMTLYERQKEMVDTFDMFEDWTDKYEYIIEMGKELPLIDDSKKTEEYLIRGCQSQVWLDAEMKDGVMELTADSDALITTGIIAVIIKVLNKSKPEEILDTDLFFLKDIGLAEHLSMNRSNGLIAMIEKVKEYAKEFAGR